MKKINVAVVGMNFGASFAQSFLNHPFVDKVYVADTNQWVLQHFLSSHPEAIATTFEEILENSEIDAVHICTGIPQHAEQSIQVLNSGKHCACAVPMATSIEEINAILEAVHRSGKNYMPMETKVFEESFFKAEEMKKNGEFGKIQHMRGVHHQPMENWPGYWEGLPPMYYATHAISPLAAINESRITEVYCLGSGSMAEELTVQYGNPYPVESAILKFENGVTAEVVRSLFETAVLSTECFNIYGSEASLITEYKYTINPSCYMKKEDYRFCHYKDEPVQVKNRYARLPKELWLDTVAPSTPDPNVPLEELVQSRGLSMHGGSHPFMVHEFVSSIVENRKPKYDEIFAANVNAAGILAHESAMNGGKVIKIPLFD